MKLTTFIRAYKLILSDISKKVKNWDRVFITQVLFDGTNIQIIFANNAELTPGTIAMRTSIDSFLVENFKSGLERLSISDKYADEVNEINDVGKFLFILDNLLSQVSSMVEDIECNAILLNVYFDIEKNLAVFDLSLTDEFETFNITTRTDGRLFMFSEYNGD